MISIYLYAAKELIGTLPKKRKVKKIKDYLERKRLSFLEAKRLSSNVLKRMNVSIEAKGLEHIPNDTPVLFVPNHQENYDIPVLFTCIQTPISFISKIEVKKIPIMREWMELLGCLFIDRKKGKDALRQISKVFDEYEEKGSYVLFPEGTRSKSADMKPFKAAGLKMAIKKNISIIPVTIDGTYRVTKKREPQKVIVTFHPLVQYENKSADAIIKEIEETIKSEIKR